MLFSAFKKKLAFLQSQRSLQVNYSRSIENLVKQGSLFLLELSVYLLHWRTLRPGSSLLQISLTLSWVDPSSFSAFDCLDLNRLLGQSQLFDSLGLVLLSLVHDYSNS